MEDSEEPEQPISFGRQEYRRRRPPSQPMVDKSQQTELTEKKKAMAAVQPPAPKATHSIGNIPGSKDNYSGKEYESLRLSSQLQQTWMKRKLGQEMTDKSFQTDTYEEEKVEVIFIDKTLTLEESTTGVGETAPELPQSIPEVEIPTSRPTSHLIDRSQQTSCTGDWSVINICPKEKVDKEQQTYFSGLEITVSSKPGSSPIKSKEETMPNAQEGSLVEINGSLEIEVQSTEKLPDVMMSFTEGEISGEFQALPADEATVKAELFSTEETPIEALSPAEETSAAETDTTTAKDVVDMQSPPADELPVEDLVPFSVEVLEEVQAVAIDTMLEDSDRAEPTTAEETTGEVQPPLSEETSKEVPYEVDYPIAAVSDEILIVVDEKFAIDEVDEDQPPIIEEVSADKATEEVQPQLAEDVSEEVAPSEVMPPPTEQGTVEDMTAEVLSPPSEEGPAEVVPPETEEAPAEVPPLPTEEGPVEVQPAAAEEGPVEVPPPPAEETPSEVPPPPAEEGPAEFPPPATEEGPAEVPPPPAEETPSEVPPPPAEEGPAEVPPPAAEETPAEDPPPPAEEGPAEVPTPTTEKVPIEVPPPQAEEGSVEVPSPPAEAGPAEVPLPPAEEGPGEVPPPPAEEGPTEVPPPATEEAPVEVLPPPAEEGPAEVPPPPAEEAPVEVPPPPAEEGPAEVPLPPAEEAPVEVPPPPAEEAPIEVPPLPAENIALDVTAEFQALSADEYPTREDTSSFEGAPIQENPAEAQLPAVEADIAENASAVHPMPLAPTGEAPAEIQMKISVKELASITLTSDKKTEGTDSVPEDVSGIKDDQISTFKIEGTIKIELKNSS